MHRTELRIVTRIKELDANDVLKPRIVALNVESIEEHFLLPLSKAAHRLGLSMTALKWCVQFLDLLLILIEIAAFLSACRKMGIKKWPYRKVHRYVIMAKDPDPEYNLLAVHRSYRPGHAHRANVFPIRR